jgi:methylated-DNA-[protein]-cysteine S-methyltransferase
MLLGAMSKFLGSSPRAVGNAMRGNPFAPRVPCHRILAADRSIGGFGGDWGANGKHVNEKLLLLKAEGVKFDSKGKVLGPIFEGFHSV